MWDCAEQWTLSGDQSHAIGFMTRCAHHAAEMGQVDAGLRLLEKSVPLAPSAAARIAIYEEMLLLARAADRFPVIEALAAEIANLRGNAGSHHSASELLCIEAIWQRSYNAPDVLPKLLNCIRDEAAHGEHRLEATWLLLRIAHECNLPDLAREVYSCVQPLLAESDSRAKWTISLIYETSFGERQRAADIARSLSEKLQSWPSVSHRLRIGLNVAFAFSFLGYSDESTSVYESLYDQASELNLVEWQVDIASGACWHFLDLELVDDAEFWYRRCESLIGSGQVGTMVRRRHFAARAEIALLRNDFQLATEALDCLVEIGSGDSDRVASHINTFLPRLRLRDPTYRCDEADLATLSEWYSRTRRSQEGPGIAAAFAEALVRTGDVDQARAVISDYLELHRPHGVSPSVSLSALMQRVGFHAAEASLEANQHYAREA